MSAADFRPNKRCSRTVRLGDVVRNVYEAARESQTCDSRQVLTLIVNRTSILSCWQIGEKER